MIQPPGRPRGMRPIPPAMTRKKPMCPMISMTATSGFFARGFHGRGGGATPGPDVFPPDDKGAGDIDRGPGAGDHAHHHGKREVVDHASAQEPEKKDGDENGEGG